MIIKVGKKALKIETICLTAFRLEKEHNHGDTVQFSLIA